MGGRASRRGRSSMSRAASSIVPARREPVRASRSGSDAQGQYHHVGGPEGDENFQGFGFVNTDAEGAIRSARSSPFRTRAARRTSISRCWKTTAAASPRRCSSEGEAGQRARDGLYSLARRGRESGDDENWRAPARDSGGALEIVAWHELSSRVTP